MLFEIQQEKNDWRSNSVWTDLRLEFCDTNEQERSLLGALSVMFKSVRTLPGTIIHNFT